MGWQEKPRKTELSSELSISRATAEDLDEVWEIIDQCAKWLAQKDLHHWADHYTKEMMSKMIAKFEVYLASKANKRVGTMTVETTPPKYYRDEGYLQYFSHPNEEALYVMAVGVLPALQGRGIAGEMLSFAEARAKEKDVLWIRLDCRIEVPGLVQFYQKRGFVCVGPNPMKEGDQEHYWLMEKKVEEKTTV